MPVLREVLAEVAASRVDAQVVHVVLMSVLLLPEYVLVNVCYR
jgi:hypothetical protein